MQTPADPSAGEIAVPSVAGPSLANGAPSTLAPVGPMETSVAEAIVAPAASKFAASTVVASPVLDSVTQPDVPLAEGMPSAAPDNDATSAPIPPLEPTASVVPVVATANSSADLGSFDSGAITADQQMMHDTSMPMDVDVDVNMDTSVDGMEGLEFSNMDMDIPMLTDEQMAELMSIAQADSSAIGDSTVGGTGGFGAEMATVQPPVAGVTTVDAVSQPPSITDQPSLTDAEMERLLQGGDIEMDPAMADLQQSTDDLGQIPLADPLLEPQPTDETGAVVQTAVDTLPVSSTGAEDVEMS